MNKTNVFLSSFVLMLGTLPAVAQTPQKLPCAEDTVLVCRARECKLASQMMTREFLYNQLGSLVENNIGKTILFCEADPILHICRTDSIRFNSVIAGAKSDVDLPSATLLDARACPDKSGYTLVLDYKMAVNETFPPCQAGLTKLTIAAVDNVLAETSGFTCNFTQNDTTKVNASYQINYVDFDYGILGATYTIATGESAQGGQTGYMLWRFHNTSNDNNELRGGNCCECDNSQVPPCQCEEKAPQIVEVEKVVEVEKTVTEYEVAPIEVTIKTKAPVDSLQKQDVVVNGVTVKDVPVIVGDTSAAPAAPVEPAPAAVPPPAAPVAPTAPVADTQVQVNLQETVSAN